MTTPQMNSNLNTPIDSRNHTKKDPRGAMFAPGEVLGNFVEEEERLLRLLDTLNNAFETRLAALASKQLMARMNIKPS